ncbi:MFS transporter, partial [Parvibaculum sp.]|uniref:MFS transporter n=1 Tax=Parvibaculum sp. TaxID=2024848 RepID=UPI002B5970D8
MEPSATDGLPIPQRYRAIAVVGLGVTMAVLDGAIANIALPTIARDLNATPAESVWIVNAYQLVVMISLLPLSSLGETIGYARIYRVGLAIFGVASLACALSDSLTTLTLARVLQGAGAACLMSVNTALIRFIYPRAQLGRGIGINAFVVATAAAAGPTIAAGILSIADWPWIFAVNVPISLLAFAISRSLPGTRRATHRFDWGSAALNAIAFALLITIIDDIG